MKSNDEYNQYINTWIQKRGQIMEDNLLLLDIFYTICVKHNNKAVATLYQFSEDGMWYAFINEVDDDFHVVSSKVAAMFENNEIKVSSIVSMLGDKYKAEISVNPGVYVNDTARLLGKFEECYNPVKDLREIAGLSQQAFAEKYGIPFGTIRNWESARNSSRHRECPEYVVRLLAFRVVHDYRIYWS